MVDMLESKNTTQEWVVRDTIDVSILGLEKIATEYNTELGRIDILTVDKEGKYVPIEVKLNVAGDRAIGQILGYMNAVEAKRGIIVAKSFSKRAEAISNKLNITLVKYVPNDDFDVFALLKAKPIYEEHTCLRQDASKLIVDSVKTYNPCASNKIVKTMDFAVPKCFDFACRAISSIGIDGHELDGWVDGVRYGLMNAGKEVRPSMGIDYLERLRLLFQRLNARHDEHAYKHLSSTQLFNGAEKEMDKAPKKEVNSTKRYAKECGIGVGELNLFNALCGLEALATTNDGYKEFKDSFMFEDLHRMLVDAERTLKWRIDVIESMLEY